MALDWQEGRLIHGCAIAMAPVCFLSKLRGQTNNDYIFLTWSKSSELMFKITEEQKQKKNSNYCSIVFHEKDGWLNFENKWINDTLSISCVIKKNLGSVVLSAHKSTKNKNSDWCSFALIGCNVFTYTHPRSSKYLLSHCTFPHQLNSLVLEKVSV